MLLQRFQVEQNTQERGKSGILCQDESNLYSNEKIMKQHSSSAEIEK